jgi:hypothetical protein
VAASHHAAGSAHDQRPAEAAVAAQQRVEGLELHVRECAFDQRRGRCRLVVQKALEVANWPPALRRALTLGLAAPVALALGEA